MISNINELLIRDFLKNDNNEFILRIMSRQCSFVEIRKPSSIFSSESLIKQLIKCLSSHKHINRLLALSCLKELFHGDYVTMFEAEAAQASVKEYREKLRLLSLLECRDGIVNDVAEAKLRLLISSLSVNFSMLWTPVTQVILTYPVNLEDNEIFWEIFLEIFKKSYLNIVKPVDDNDNQVDFVNFRNLLLKCLESVPTTQLLKKNKFLSPLFLDHFAKNEFSTRKCSSTFVKELQDDDDDDQQMEDEDSKMEIDDDEEETSVVVPKVVVSLTAHLKIFSKFANLQSVHRFNELRDFTLNLLTDPAYEIRKGAVEVAATFDKFVKANTDILIKLTEKKTWKHALSEMMEKMDAFEKILFIWSRLISGHFKSTRSEKRPKQLASRKFILEKIMKLPADKSLNMLSMIIHDLFPSLTKILNPEFKIEKTSYVQKETFPELVFDIFSLTRNYMADNVNICRGLIKCVSCIISNEMENKGIKSKSRTKIIVAMSALFKNLREQYEWSKKEKIQFLNDCIMPCLQSVSSLLESEDEFSVSGKLMTFIKYLATESHFVNWFFIDHAKILNWIYNGLSSSNNKNDLFKKQNLDIFCYVINSTPSDDEQVLTSKFEFLLPLIIESINIKAKTEDVILRFNTIGRMNECNNFKLNEKQLETLCSLTGTIKFSQESLQGDVIDILNALIRKSQNNISTIPASAFHLLLKIQDHGKKTKFTQTLLGILVGHDVAKKFKGYEINGDICDRFRDIRTLTDKNKQIKLFLFYNAWSELYRTEYTNRRQASDCLIGLVGTELDEEFVRKTVLSEIGRSFDSKRVTEETLKEIIAILQHLLINFGKCDIADLNYLSILTNVHDLDEDFFANIKHLQSHRKTKAMRRMAIKMESLPEEEMEKYEKVIFTYIYPLTSKVLFNDSTVKYSETIESSMDLIGSIAMKLNFNRYKKMLNYFLSSDETKFDGNQAFTKQKIKIISRILSSFHFPDQNMKYLIAQVFKIMDTENENSTHESLYLPVIKILKQFPDLIDEFLSRIIVKLAKGLRMREFKARERVRTTLNNVALILGPNYFPFILSILESSLQRGYETHVLIYSAKCLLTFCSNSFVTGSLDKVSEQIIKLIQTELYSKVTQEEKKISKIATKTPEAKKISSFTMMEILSKFASKSTVMNILEPFAVQLSQCRDFDAVDKIRKLYKSMATGFTSNDDIESSELLKIIFAILSQKILGNKINLTSRQRTVLVEFSFALLSRILNDNSDGVTPASVKPLIPLILSQVKSIKDVDILIDSLSIFHRLIHHKSFQKLISFDEIFPIIVKSLIIDDIFAQSVDKSRFTDLSSSLLDGYLRQTDDGKFDTESINVFLQHLLDGKSLTPRTINLLGTTMGFSTFSKFRHETISKICNVYIKSEDNNLVETSKAVILRFVRKGNPTWTINFLLQQFEYPVDNGKYFSFIATSL